MFNGTNREGGGGNQIPTHLKAFQIRHDIGPHQTEIDFVATPFVVCSHTPGTCALVEALVHVLGRQRKLAVSPAEGLCWFEHDGGGGVWPGMAVIGCRVQRKEARWSENLSCSSSLECRLRERRERVSVKVPAVRFSGRNFGRVLPAVGSCPAPGSIRGVQMFPHSPIGPDY